MRRTQNSIKTDVDKKIPILSFFSGGGFLDMGFEMADFEIVWTNENDKDFVELHKAGITSWRKKRGNKKVAEIFNTNSIEEITPSDIVSEAFNGIRPEKFGIIGGPPCQDFSTSGNNMGFDGERGHLTKVFFEYITEISPSFFVFENVRNLYNNNEHKKKLEQILSKVRKSYFVDGKILNSINYGVPQDRNRLFIIGIKKTEAAKNSLMEQEFNFPWPTVAPRYKNALTKYEWPDVSKFQNGVQQPSGLPLELCVNSCILKEAEEENHPNGKEYFGSYSSKFWKVNEGNTHSRSFKRLHRYRYSPTACYGNNEVHLHPFLPRRISVREALRIQTVADSYVLPAEIGLTSKFKMIGNGVPVKLAFAVAKSVERFLANKTDK
ncbi:MAG: cytosine methyltransferase [Bacteroidota bacterium]|nr:cytosine methyltransferase [Bacteroidota bacterium]